MLLSGENRMTTQREDRVLRAFILRISDEQVHLRSLEETKGYHLDGYSAVVERVGV